MRIGLALPQYDFSVPGENPLQWETVLAAAQRAETLGFDSVWLSDHLLFDIAKYGGGDGFYGIYEPIVTLAALGRATARVRLGTLVLCEALRPATVLAKALATLDQITGGRLDIGVGAGRYEPDYDAIGLPFPSPKERLARLRETLDVLDGMLGGGPFTYDGHWYTASDARNLPPARQAPRPPVIIGGSGDRLLQLVAERADGWNTCWVWTPDAYAERAAVLDRACERAGRDPASVRRSLALYALAGTDATDLARRYARLQQSVPNGMLDGMTLDQWREGRLVGTVAELREQVARWDALGVDEIIVGPGALPFSMVSTDDVDLLSEALTPLASKS
jgi:probable F420-dependent oxidoreductase